MYPENSKIYQFILETLSVLLIVSYCNSLPTIPKSADTLPNTIATKDDEYRLQYAQQMLSYMNLSVNPCEDFYEYACGNWKNVMDERQSEQKRVNVLDIGYKLGKIIKDMLETDISDVAPEYVVEFEIAKKFYQQCLDTQLYPIRKAPEYLEIIQEIGGFPALEKNWNASRFSWFNMSAQMNRYGIGSIIKEEIMSEFPFMPYFSLPTFGFDIELHHDNINSFYSKAYLVNRKRMRDILTLYEIDAEQINIIIEDISDFLKLILSVMTQFEEDEYKCEELSEAMEKSEVDTITQQWMAYFDIVWQGKFHMLTEDNRPCFYFYRELNRIAEKHKKAVANYLSLKFLYHMDARLEDPKFQKDYCTRTLRNSMSFLFDHLYMKLFFNKETADDVRRMATEIQRSLRRVIHKADWMDKPTRKAALRKESSMQIHVGRYEDPVANKQILKEFKNLIFVNGSYEVNRLNLKLFKSYMNRYYGLHQEDFGDHTKPMQMMLGMEINAFYYPIDNSLYIAAGILQPPTYHSTWPNSLKYGTLGYILGHEFTHGFDEQGATYDYRGENVLWWSNESVNRFEKRAQCFIDSYSNYCVPEINRHINGRLTLNENIADAGGLHLALMTYRRYVNDERKKGDTTWMTLVKEEQMPGLHLLPEQLFFLGAAQIWCSSYREADYWQELSNSHTIEKYRVLGFVKNNKDFEQVFECTDVIDDKCHIW